MIYVQLACFFFENNCLSHASWHHATLAVVLLLQDVYMYTVQSWACDNFVQC